MVVSYLDPLIRRVPPGLGGLGPLFRGSIPGGGDFGPPQNGPKPPKYPKIGVFGPPQ